MLRIFRKSKITGAFITGKEMRYDGSIGIDKAILEEIDLLPGEQVHVLNINNGERFRTYAIEEKARSGKIVLYGPAVRMGEVGDELVILSYCLLEDKEIRNFVNKTAVLDKNNQIKGK
ncbi:MAG: aspartate 1-decarboxylase [Candidatus Omnitrophica bacterium]|nr:aspartate 1-decarboxylase [Candidatus Omnitrophota bacterium]